MKPLTPGGRIEAVLRGFPKGGTAKILMVGIAAHDGEGGSWPSVDTLAEYACVDRRNVQRATARLAEEGWLTITTNEGGTRNTRDNYRPNLYEIDYDRLLEGIAGAADAPPLANPGVAPASRQGRRGRAPGVAPAPPEQDRTGHEQDPLSADADGGSSTLFGEPPPKPTDAVKDEAHRVTTTVWERSDPKPVWSFIGVQRMAERFLRGGWTAPEIIDAMLAVPSITQGWVEPELKRRRPQRRDVDYEPRDAPGMAT